MKKIDHTKGLCGKPNIDINTPLEEAKKIDIRCLCCDTKMQIVADGGSLEQLGVYVVICPFCPSEDK